MKKNLKLCDRSDYEKKARKGLPSFFELELLFRCETSAFDYLCEKGIFLTPKCDSCNRMMSKRNGRNSYRCHKCSKERSAFKGTFFSNCRIPLSTALFLVWAWCGQLTWLQVYQFTGLSKDTCTKWWVYLRELVTQLVRQTDNRIGGEGKVVQIDESKFGKRKKTKSRRGHRVEGAWVFGGVEKGAGELYGNNKAFSVVVEDRKAETLLPLIIK